MGQRHGKSISVLQMVPMATKMVVGVSSLRIPIHWLLLTILLPVLGTPVHDALPLHTILIPVQGQNRQVRRCYDSSDSSVLESLCLLVLAVQDVTLVSLVDRCILACNIVYSLPHIYSYTKRAGNSDTGRPKEVS